MSRATQFLKDITYNSKYKILEIAENKDELNEIAEKCRIVIPNEDLAIFKCVYGYVNRQNMNGCTLPKQEVERVLGTLIGKAINFDHLRECVVGHWIDAKIDGDEIIAYGVFFKGNFKEDYDLVKQLLEGGDVAISFEAYGIKVGSSSSYDLTDIEFSGGALLIKSTPAFPGAKVNEMAKKRVLELAKTMVEPKNLMREKGRWSVYDNDSIIRTIDDVKCPFCSSKYMFEVKKINYSTQKVDVKCMYCGAESNIILTPQIVLIKDGKELLKSSEENTDKGGDNKMEKTLEELKIKVKELSTDCEKKDESFKKLQEDVKAKDEKIVELEESLKKIADDKKKTDEVDFKDKFDKASEELIKKDEQINEIAEKLKKFEGEVAEKAEKDKQLKIAERREKLGEEFSKDLKDEELLDDKVYQIATLKKQVQLFKAGNLEEAQKLEVGTVTEPNEGKSFTLADKVRKVAWDIEE